MAASRLSIGSFAGRKALESASGPMSGAANLLLRGM